MTVSGLRTAKRKPRTEFGIMHLVTCYPFVAWLLIDPKWVITSFGSCSFESVKLGHFQKPAKIWGVGLESVGPFSGSRYPVACLIYLLSMAWVQKNACLEPPSDQPHFSKGSWRFQVESKKATTWDRDRKWNGKPRSTASVQSDLFVCRACP